ncbi:substrate-binding domain-containing protein [Kutzneria buriramensis]|uniref:von Willebrand factor type A domain-containing protein n=1 Tax=Kutzneria buriramensis TaxID=1045776 RepID=A0A3E0GY20_9PSEU|nr:substrate-binding domain-containing protein [Kutzneria buriramensis]REH33098.1 von Willebrand factor type A domain-containing protein [Kutzneria buriramensis]
MAAHHSRDSRHPLRPFLLPLMVASLAVTGVVVANAVRSSHCHGQSVTLRVVVAPAMLAPVRNIAEAFDPSAADGPCFSVEVAGEQAAQVVQDLPVNPIDPPALWIPDSSLWVPTAQQLESKITGPTPHLLEHSSLASSPLVIATSQQQAAKMGWPASRVSWQQLVGGDVAIADPLSNTEGIATLALAQQLSPASTGTPPPQLISALLKLRSSTVDSVDSAFGVLQGKPGAVFTTTEQSVVAHNASATTKVVAVYPAEGSVLFDYPVVRVATNTESSAVAAAATSFENELRSARSMGVFAAAGFRDPHAVASASWGGKDGVRSQTPAILPAPTADQVTTVMRAWNVVHLDGRTLAIIDTSGSMNEPMPDHQKRIEVARDGALAGLSLMPDTTAVGLWTFAQQTTELVPLGPLGGLDHGVPQRLALQQAGLTLPGRVGGSTALYDTALSGFEELRSTYDPTKVNAEVLITDGRNETPGGLDLNSLLTKLRTEVDPTRPIEIIGIGLGPDADMNVLNQIAAATGGKAYQALDGAAFRAVFFDALSRRPCTSGTC